MAGRDSTPVTAGDQRRGPDGGRPVEELRAETQSGGVGDDERTAGPANGVGQSEGTPAAGRKPKKRSRFGKLPYWAAMPVEVSVGLGALVAAAVIVLLVLSLWALPG